MVFLPERDLPREIPERKRPKEAAPGAAAESAPETPESAARKEAARERADVAAELDAAKELSAQAEEALENAQTFIESVGSDPKIEAQVRALTAQADAAKKRVAELESEIGSLG